MAKTYRQFLATAYAQIQQIGEVSEGICECLHIQRTIKTYSF